LVQRGAQLRQFVVAVHVELDPWVTGIDSLNGGPQFIDRPRDRAGQLAGE